jgi:hypothetical protein
VVVVCVLDYVVDMFVNLKFPRRKMLQLLEAIGSLTMVICTIGMLIIGIFGDAFPKEKRKPMTRRWIGLKAFNLL